MVLERRDPGRAVTPWSPFRELQEMQRRFDEVFGGPSFPSVWRCLPEEMSWAPAVEILDKDDKFVVKAELPGVKQEDMEVSVEGDTLMIKGEKKVEKETKEENYYRSERAYGSFYRSIALPSTVNASKIAADYEDGVLEVTLPKAAEAKPKKIEVKAKKKTS